ncbi:hypothetical protein D3C76_922370 [compost metagenome]
MAAFVLATFGVEDSERYKLRVLSARSARRLYALRILVEGETDVVNDNGEDEE